MQTQPNMEQVTEQGYYPSYNPKKGYKRRMVIAGIMALVLTCVTLYGIDAAVDGAVPQIIVLIYNGINTVCTFLFVSNGTFNNKTLFIVLMFLVFAWIGMYRVLGGWALWLCSRDKERGQLYSWFPNLLHHEYAVEQYKQVGKDEEIKKLQQRITELEALNAAHTIVFDELNVTVKDTLRERRLVMNLDHLIGKCYNLAAKSFTLRDKEPYRLNLFLSSICAEICSTTIDSTNNKHAYIFLRNIPEESMVLVGECRSGSSIDGSLKFSKGEGFVGQVWEENRRILYTDISSQAAHIIVKQGERRYNSIVGLPIMHHGEMIGVVVVASQSKDEVSEADFDNIERYLNIIQLSLLIELSYQVRLGGDEHAILLELLSQKVSF
ncbi:MULTISPECIES: GAF domain-containing protein [unclassified Paenibacillus]|uniref:GAF domain-containing protein n=1 Tax=unclassified Paenibacillus TaxID=185978 RepID=UPI002786948D|nr:MULTISPECIES: GAF domain-containing protein [unclassified Paenibacillus]MDQ0896397.1 putative methionine-R-sulfoxide reductase with GAF domain [Paenibacillus sp. V4I7]MDQ0914059.1 putative methionine-R-sulfoxide reductase with GAF domain [Paenibacillus sp. V4I5]